MDVSTQGLLTSASPYNNNESGDLCLIKLGLLKTILTSINPMADVTPQGLITAAAPYNNLPPGLWKLVELGLLQQIAINGGSITSGAGVPSSTASTGALYLNTTDNTLWVYNGTWKQLV